MAEPRFETVQAHYVYPFILTRRDGWGRDGRLPQVPSYAASEVAWEKAATGPHCAEAPQEYFAPPFVRFNTPFICFTRRAPMLGAVAFGDGGRSERVQLAVTAKWHSSGAGTVRITVRAEGGSREWPRDQLLGMCDLDAEKSVSRATLVLDDEGGLGELCELFIGELAAATEGKRIDAEGPELRQASDSRAMAGKPLILGPCYRPRQLGYPVLGLRAADETATAALVGVPGAPGWGIHLCTRVTNTPEYERYQEHGLFTRDGDAVKLRSLNANSEVLFNFGYKGGVVATRSGAKGLGLDPDRAADVETMSLEAIESVRLRWYVLGCTNIWLDHWLQDLEERLHRLENQQGRAQAPTALGSDELLRIAEATLLSAVHQKASMARLLQGMLVHESGSTGANEIERRAAEVFQTGALLSLFTTKQAIADSTARDFLEAVQVLDLRRRHDLERSRTWDRADS